MERSFKMAASGNKSNIDKIKEMLDNLTEQNTEHVNEEGHACTELIKDYFNISKSRVVKSTVKIKQ